MSEDLKNLTQAKVKELLAKAKERRSKIVQVPFRHVLEIDWNRRFGFKERIQILFGYSLNVLIRIPTLHKPGELGAIIMAETCEHGTATEMMRDRAKKALEKEYGSLLPTEPSSDPADAPRLR